MSASTHFGETTALRPEGGPEREISASEGTLLFVTGPATISQRLVDALCREFPTLALERSERPSRLLVPQARPLALVLFDATLLTEALDVLPTLKRLHPRTHAAIIEFDDERPVSSLHEICRSKSISGILPMNLGLDAWLAIVRLLLCGGEYFPARMVRASIADNRDAASTANDTPTRVPHAFPIVLSVLTARENQILERVSRGLQNKAIAADLSLSESTVKIHIHNIIRKLGAHNRTEAAASFMNGNPR